MAKNVISPTGAQQLLLREANLILAISMCITPPWIKFKKFEPFTLFINDYSKYFLSGKWLGQSGIELEYLLLKLKWDP